MWNLSFNTSPAYQPIKDWLSEGLKTDRVTRGLLLCTGNERERVIRRFVNHLDLDLRKGVLVSTNGGAILYYHDQNGMQEDLNFRKNSIPNGTLINPEQVPLVVNECKSYIHQFFSRLKTDEALRHKLETHLKGRFKFLLNCNYQEAELVTLDTTKVPRIEVRRTADQAVVQIALIGIPSFIDDMDFKQIEKKFTGLTVCRINLTVEITVQGVDKQLVLKYLGINPARSFGMGDSPHENDFPLTNFLTMLFVSVCNNLEKVRAELLALHIGQNMHGAARLIHLLVVESRKLEKSSDSVIQKRLIDCVKQVQQNL